MSAARILLVGTADTKSAEILFLCQCIEQAGGSVSVMDVGVLGAPRAFVPSIGHGEVAAAAGTTLAVLAACGDENHAIGQMALGASRIAARRFAAGEFDGLLALGGTMGTDLALAVASALPVGVPKVILSTVAHSSLLAPQRIPPDLIAVLWAGGLCGLNRLSRASMAQAAGAVVGACKSLTGQDTTRPLIGMTSLGSTVLKYMKPLTAALESRGYEVAVFHTAGMGGRAFETIAAKKGFAAVFDFSLQELANELLGSSVSAGPDRLCNAGLAGVPQLVAPGAIDMVDFSTEQGLPPGLRGRDAHVHNQLVSCVATTADERRMIARAICERLEQSRGPTCLLLPLGGIDEWDRVGQAMHAPEAQMAFVGELRAIEKSFAFVETGAHINDAAFCEQVLSVFDQWVAQGQVPSAAEFTPEQEAA
jgi:uncharacterized protein (UPF0261 family)